MWAQHELGWIPPKSNRLVNDQAGLLSPEQQNTMEQRLIALDDSTSVQVMVLTTPSLYGRDIFDFAQEVGEAWGVGSKESDNGLIIIVKPKNESDGEVHIHVGYGLEGALPDAFCKRIIEDDMIPHFRDDDDYYAGIVAALDVIEPVCKGEYSFADRQREDRRENTIGITIFLALMILVIVLTYMGSKNGGGSANGGSSSGGFDDPTGPVYWGGGNFGGSSLGRSGGGFGGFGGGHFGGGGASGRW